MGGLDGLRIWAFVLLSCQNYAVFTTLRLIDPSVFLKRNCPFCDSSFSFILCFFIVFLMSKIGHGLGLNV
jgi:hypothetical protein